MAHPDETPAADRVVVAAYRRADLPADHEEHIDDILSGFQAAVRDGTIDALHVAAWPRRVRLDRGAMPVERFRAFERWAGEAGVWIRPPFAIRSGGPDEAVLVLPALVIAVTVNGSIARVVPHEGPTGTETVHTALERLHADGRAALVTSP